jgi:hypothetical protein
MEEREKIGDRRGEDKRQESGDRSQESEWKRGRR